MKIIKRNGAEVVFDINKITMAVTKANEAVEESVRMTPLQIRRISESVQIACEELGRSPSVEEIQDLVEKAIMAHGAYEVAKQYITYRYTRFRNFYVSIISTCRIEHHVFFSARVVFYFCRPKIHRSNWVRPIFMETISRPLFCIRSNTRSREI